MIALVPQLLLSPKGQSAKAPPAENPLPTDASAVPQSDFAAWVAKAIAGATDLKSTGEKSAVKPNTPDQATALLQVADPNLAALVGIDPPPAAPSTPLPKLVGHFASDAKGAVASATNATSPATSEPRSQPKSPTTATAASSALQTHGKAATPIRAAIEPALPETGAKGHLAAAPKSAPNLDGMAVAQNEQRMNSTAEQNKIAGQATQNLPPDAISSVAAVKAASPAGKVRLPVDFSPRDDSAQQLSLTAKAPSIADSSTNVASAPTAATASAVHATNPIDRVEQLIAREAISFKQSGANDVGVSLKVDAHTQLFLQLSYRDGQTQAILRCEKGDLPALNSHFGQLQESLARQNIQLQPSSGGGLDLNRQGSSGQSWREQSQEPSLKDEAKLITPSKPQSKPVSRRGWESWA